VSAKHTGEGGVYCTWTRLPQHEWLCPPGDSRLHKAVEITHEESQQHILYLNMHLLMGSPPSLWWCLRGKLCTALTAPCWSCRSLGHRVLPGQGPSGSSQEAHLSRHTVLVSVWIGR